MKDYILDAFTKTEDGLNGEFNNLTVNCINSKNNKFNLDCEGNLIVNSITATKGIDQPQKIYFPVGTIYWNRYDISEELNNTFEGEWKRIKDVFVLAAGEKFLTGTKGGEEEHVLTEGEIPRHTHCYGYTVKTFYDSGYGVETIDNIQAPSSGKENYVWENAVGNNQPHNNMPPYEVAFCWERVK